MQFQLCVHIEVCGENASRLVTGGGGISWQKASVWIQQSRKLTAVRDPCCPSRASCVTGSSPPAPWSSSERKETIRPAGQLNTHSEPRLNFPHLVQLLFSDVGFVLGAQSSERALYLLTGLDVFCFTADHECHVLLQWHVSIPANTQFSQLDSKYKCVYTKHLDGSYLLKMWPVGIHSVEYSLKLWIRFALFHHGQVVAQRAQTGLELLVVQTTRLLLVKMPAYQQL